VDGLAYALPVTRHLCRVEASPPVAHEHRKGGWLDFGIDGHDIRSGPFSRIDSSLSRRRQQRFRCLVQGRVSYRHQFDAHAVVRFDLLLEGEQGPADAGRAQAVPLARRSVEQPRPELALLSTGQPLDLLGVAGRSLDQGQGLEHRVMKVGGHLGSFLSPGALTTLAGQIPA
jgi:hypothetical protein